MAEVTLTQWIKVSQTEAPQQRKLTFNKLRSPYQIIVVSHFKESCEYRGMF